jgi:exonuclease VII large subunit
LQACWEERDFQLIRCIATCREEGATEAAALALQEEEEEEEEEETRTLLPPLPHPLLRLTRQHLEHLLRHLEASPQHPLPEEHHPHPHLRAWVAAEPHLVA